MTSKHASRNARAMIFAPRSWPSSPGFPTRTRTFRSPFLLLPSDLSLARALAMSCPPCCVLIHRRVGIRSHRFPEGVADFAERDIVLHRVEDDGHQVGPGEGRVLQRVDAGNHPFRVSFPADFPGAGDLLPFDLLVDLQGRYGGVLGALVAGGPPAPLLPLFQEPLVVVGGVDDLPLRIPALYGLDHSPHLVDPPDVGHSL